MNIDEKINNGREYRNFQVPFEIRAKEDDGMIVEGYATTFNEKYLLWEEDGYEVWEQVDARAFDETDMSDVIMQYNHEGRVFARLSNGTLELDADEHGLKVRADLGGTEIGRQLYEEIKGGYTNKMSFGFTVKTDDVENKKEDAKTVITRTITDIAKLYDVSAVSIPANDGTTISARSFSDGVIAEAEAERMRAEEEARLLEHKRKALELRLKLMEV
jgi:hypothetical protein